MNKRFIHYTRNYHQDGRKNSTPRGIISHAEAKPCGGGDNSNITMRSAQERTEQNLPQKYVSERGVTENN